MSCFTIEISQSFNVNSLSFLVLITVFYLQMLSRCVAAGCSNTTKEGASVNRFPSDAYHRRIWMADVKLTRAK